MKLRQKTPPTMKYCHKTPPLHFYSIKGITSIILTHRLAKSSQSIHYPNDNVSYFLLTSDTDFVQATSKSTTNYMHASKDPAPSRNKMTKAIVVNCSCQIVIINYNIIWYINYFVN